MPSVSFDRAIDYYDQTRGFGPGVAERIRNAIINYTHTDFNSRFLELGIGTGRIALPFIEAGYDYTGVDISSKMMDKLKQKLTQDSRDDKVHPYRYHLEQADITQELPFAPHTFDVIIAVHVLHLVGDWQTALVQAKRVLKPHGYLLLARDNQADSSQDPHQRVNQKWNEIVHELGVEQGSLRPGFWLSNETLEAYLKGELGATTEMVNLAEYERIPVSMQEMAARHQARMYSSDWGLDEATHAEASRRIQQWLDNDIGSTQANQPVVSTNTFAALAAHW